jgi:hypothetical protein
MTSRRTAPRQLVTPGLVGAAVLAALALLPAASPAATTVSAVAARRPPLLLPGSVGASRLSADRDGWIVGARPGSQATAIARRFGARSLLRGAAIYKVPLGRASAFASALEAAGQLAFAEPNARARRQSFPSDPGTGFQWWLPAVVAQSITPPPVTSKSPLLAIADSQAKLNHNELAGHVASTTTGAVTDEHGTAVAAVASASDNGTGIVGIWPGMRVLDSVNELNCSSLVQSLNRAIQANAAVINMSYGFTVGSCFAHEVATNVAFGRGIIPVAAGGNDFEQGNKPVSPAVDPHVLTVSAIDRQRHSAYFSSENNAIDVAAPGTDILTAVPPAFDDDGHVDGYGVLNGTSFSAPIVSAAAAWIFQARPKLANDQVVEAIRHSAQDLGQQGWDPRFGYGLLKIGRALNAGVPAHDPNEPNDDIVWVDGSLFAPDPYIFKPPDTQRSKSGRLDQLEDPADVYRVRVAAHAKLQFKLVPSYGDPDLELYKGSAQTIYSTNGRLRSSTRSGLSTDSFTWTNNSSKGVTVYVDTYINPSVPQLDAAYKLTVKKL